MADQLTAAELQQLDALLDDPAPDVHALFAYYNDLYFDNCLGACSVEWSTKRMTLCAGVCHFSNSGGCRIKLSEPLLKFRPVGDLKDTLLHEMIHAELFLKSERDGDHGPKFRTRMAAINGATCKDPQRPPGGYNITVYHTMHDEVNVYRTHVWSCSRCGNTIKRSMNRPPQEADCRAYTKAGAAAAAAAGAPGSYCGDARCWYHLHTKQCGGQYVKISWPEKEQSNKQGASSSSTAAVPNGGSSSNKRPKQPAVTGMAPINTFFQPDRQQQQQGGGLQQQQQGGQQQLQPPPAPQQQNTQELQVPLGQLQEQQQRPPDYWASLGKGRTLGGPPSKVQGREGSIAQAAAAPPRQQQQQLPGQPRWPPQQQPHRQPSTQPLPLLPVQVQQQQMQQQQQQQQSKASGGAAGGGGSKASSTDAVEVVELLSSDDEDEEDAAAAAAAAAAAGGGGSDGKGARHLAGSVVGAAAAAAGLKTSSGAGRMGGLPAPAGAAGAAGARGGGAGAAGVQGAASRGVRGQGVAGSGGTPGFGSGGRVVGAGGVELGSGACLTCPVCCQEWLPGEISNAELNAHLDGCLARMH